MKIKGLKRGEETRITYVNFLNETIEKNVVFLSSGNFCSVFDEGNDKVLFVVKDDKNIFGKEIFRTNWHGTSILIPEIEKIGSIENRGAYGKVYYYEVYEGEKFYKLDKQNRKIVNQVIDLYDEIYMQWARKMSSFKHMFGYYVASDFIGLLAEKNLDDFSNAYEILLYRVLDWYAEKFYLDVHIKNFMQDQNGQIKIIDAAFLAEQNER